MSSAGRAGSWQVKTGTPSHHNIQLKPCLGRCPIFLKKKAGPGGGEVFFLRLTKPSKIEATSISVISVEKKMTKYYILLHNIKNRVPHSRTPRIEGRPLLVECSPHRVHRCKLAGNERDRAPHDLQDKHDGDQARIGSKASNTEHATECQGDNLLRTSASQECAMHHQQAQQWSAPPAHAWERKQQLGRRATS